MSQSTLFKDKEKERLGGVAGSEELLLQAYVEFMMDEEVPLENVAVRMESIRTTVPFAPNSEKESDIIPERNARPPSKRLSMNSSHEEGGLLQRQKFSREIRLDSEPISTQRPPLVGGRNSLRLIPSCEEQDSIQSVLSPSHSSGGGGYPPSPRTSIRVESMSSHRGSMRIDQSMIDSILASSAAANRDSISTKVTIETVAMPWPKILRNPVFHMAAL